MYISLNNLNEGRSENFADDRKRELYEGENPKSTITSPASEGWLLGRQLSYVNSNWEKLRK